MSLLLDCDPEGTFGAPLALEKTTSVARLGEAVSKAWLFGGAQDGEEVIVK